MMPVVVSFIINFVFYKFLEYFYTNIFDCIHMAIGKRLKSGSKIMTLAGLELASSVLDEPGFWSYWVSDYITKL